jgi:predicted 2-oxoglutarate/Fe(II)-dependent dioxygenase YbiX
MPSRLLSPGEPAPWFTCRSPVNPRFAFDTVAGRYVVLCFFGSAGDAAGARLAAAAAARGDVFDGAQVHFFGVSTDPDDERLARLPPWRHGIGWFWDFDGAVSRSFGAAQRVSYLLDMRLRVLTVVPFNGDARKHLDALVRLCARLPPIGPGRPARASAPVLMVPRVFEPALCRSLIELYEREGGGDSGFMQERDGKTVGVINHAHKSRRDCDVRPPALREACSARIWQRLRPELAKAFQFHAAHIERFIVSCYDAHEGGHFRAHRDNTTTATAHRRFAVSLFLNTGAYDGGFLRFPEFGPQLYCAPAGGAVVFSCSLLHEATPVTRGRRYMFLPFLYDEASAKLRAENRGGVVRRAQRPA